jgi:drug/metabolite transporter (DMT)-like permease
MKSTKYTGIILIILSALFFSLMATTVKTVNEFPLVQKVFFRNFIGLLILSYFIIKDRSLLKVNNKKIMAARCTFGLIGVFLYYQSLSMLNLSEAVVINKLSPFFVIVLGGLILKEKISPIQFLAVFIALGGIVVLVQPQVSVDILPALIGILGAVSAAAAYTAVRQLRLSDKPMTIVYYFCLTSTIVTLPLMIPVFEMPNLLDLFQLSLIGIFAVIAQLLMTNAYRHAPASQLSIYTYLNIVFSSIWGLLFWSESLEASFLLGAGLIIFAGFLNFINANKQNQKAS